MSRLFLIPNAIAEEGFDQLKVLAPSVSRLRVFFVEEPKSARRLLRQLDSGFPLAECRFMDLNEHTKARDIGEYLKLLKETDCGIISESGCPCIADPGADLVLLAHQNNIQVVPLVGPSAILLALMASGLPGQNFAFNGYLPKSDPERSSRIRALEKRSREEGQTQAFMETPYRNQALFDDFLRLCQAGTRLCVALDLMGSEGMVLTKTVGEWKKAGLVLPRKPALFIIHS